MNKIHYYLTLFPTEALIASMLEPALFGSYMATGSNRGSHERLIFAEIEGDFPSDFDWEYARARTVPHEDGTSKSSVYLGVYRILERVPFDKLGTLYLTTSGGETLALEKSVFPNTFPKTPYYLYQDLCPVQPLVITAMPPDEYGTYMVSCDCKIKLPAICYCDLKVIDPEDPVDTGNLGPIYSRNTAHLEDCIEAVTTHGKLSKTLARTFSAKFTYQIVKSGFAFVQPDIRVWYPMPAFDDLIAKNYDWARSAMLV